MSTTDARALTLLTAFVATAGLLLLIAPSRPSVEAASRQDENATLPSEPTRPVNRNRKSREPRHPSPTSAGKAVNRNKAVPKRNAAAKTGNANKATRPRLMSPIRNTKPKGANTGARPSAQGASPPAGDSVVRPTDMATPLRAAGPAKSDAGILLSRDFPPPEFARLSPLPRLNLTLLREAEKTLITKGTLREIAGMRKVFVNLAGNVAGDIITRELRNYGKLEVVKTAREADFAVQYYYWTNMVVRGAGEAVPDSDGGGIMIVTIRDHIINGTPRVIWWKGDNEGRDKTTHDRVFSDIWLTYAYAGLVDPPRRLTEQFISELKKLRGEK